MYICLHIQKISLLIWEIGFLLLSIMEKFYLEES